jgi:hypothetical protein
MAINDTGNRHAFERRFFLAIAILFPITVLIGFAPTYYLKGFFESPPVPRLIIHIHAFVMALWVVLFGLQVYLIRSKRIKVHQRLGLLSVIVGVTIIITGLMFLIVPFGDVLVFAVLFAAAVYYRRNAPNHKRLMLLTVLNFIPAAIARFPFGLTASYGPLWFFGVPDILAIVFVIADTWKNRKLNKVFLAGAIFLIASHWLRLAVASSPTWLNFATWVTGA